MEGESDLQGRQVPPLSGLETTIAYDASNRDHECLSLGVRQGPTKHYAFVSRSALEVLIKGFASLCYKWIVLIQCAGCQTTGLMNNMCSYKGLAFATKPTS